MTNSEQHLNGPTKRQLKYLRGLATKTGGSFAWPRTSAEAREEIERLQKTSPTDRADRRRETLQVRDDMVTRLGDAASVRVDEETRGHGSTAHWR